MVQVQLLLPHVSHTVFTEEITTFAPRSQNVLEFTENTGFRIQDILRMNNFVTLFHTPNKGD